LNHPCPNCGSNETVRVLRETPIFNKFMYKRYKCRKCGKIFIHDAVNDGITVNGNPRKWDDTGGL